MINKNLLFKIGIIILVISIFIGYSYINNDINFTSNVTVNKYDCNQSNLYDRLSCMSIIDNVKSKYVSNNLGISFTNISSNTNGNGIYRMASTEADTYPISYYRGAVNNNNLKFAGYCWKIVRTTNTGGTKIIYNGEPDNNGYCNPTTSVIKSTKYSTYTNSLSYIGYMNGVGYPYTNYDISATNLYGKSFKYENSTYTLVDTTNSPGDFSNYHYTCFNNTGSCQNLGYIYSSTNTTTHFKYTTLSNGENIGNRLNTAKNDNSNSIIKGEIDSWFATNLLDKADKLEDTIWCNDRDFNQYGDSTYTSNGYNPNGGNIKNYTYFNGYGRLTIMYTPSLDCNSTIDSYTKNNSNGNGKLIYPIGLITADEVSLAGGKFNTDNNDIYLKCNEDFWTMTPASLIYSYYAHTFLLILTVNYQKKI